MKERMGDMAFETAEWKKAAREEERKKSYSLSELVELNRTLELAVKSGRYMRFMPIDLRVPKFHLQFSKGSGWPEGCDVSQCKERLLAAYEHGRSAKMLYNTYITGGKDSVVADHVCRRLGGTFCADEATLRWYFSSEHGDIYPTPRQYIYNPIVRIAFQTKFLPESILTLVLWLSPSALST
jgi:hypothetical protein